MKITSGLARNPLIDTMLIFYNQVDQDLIINTDDLNFTVTRMNRNNAVVDLMIAAYYEKDGSVTCSWQYNADLFRRETIIRMVGHFQNISQAMLTNPAQKLGEIELLSPTERESDSLPVQ